MSRPSGWAGRAFGAARLAWGLTLLAVPDRCIELAGGPSAGGGSSGGAGAPGGGAGAPGGGVGGRQPGDGVGAPGADARRIARVLGARHVLQAGVELAAWPRWRRLGATADLLHAASGVGLAAVDPRWRRVALADAALATSWAVVGIALG